MSHSKIIKSLHIISLLVIGVVYPILAKTSQPLFIQVDKAIANDGQGGDQFGVSVAIDGDTVVVGANSAAVGGNNLQGAAYVFIRSGSGWTQQAKLTADDGQAQDRFGVSVAISGDTILVGAVNDAGNGNRRATYVFTRSGSSWVQQAKTGSNSWA